MSWFIGQETDYYTPREPDCPCSDAGLLSCFCGGSVYPDDARAWLRGQGVDVEGLHATDVIVEVEERHPGGWEGFFDECAAEKARRLVYGFTNDYAAIVAKARAAA